MGAHRDGNDYRGSSNTGVPGAGLRVGTKNLPLPSHLIRVMPAKGEGMPNGSLAVVGGGVIGLAVARRAALDGWSVRVHRTDERGASWVAGGMLAPHSEGWPGEERLLRLGLASLALWHGGFLDGLPADVVTARESLVVAVDRADAADLQDGRGVAGRAGPPGDADDQRARYRTAAGAGHSARLPRGNRTGGRQPGGGRGVGGPLRTARRAVGAAGGRRWTKPVMPTRW